MSIEDEKWIREHRMKNDIWNIFFMERSNGWKKKEVSVKTARTMSRDILDAKKKRLIEGPFSKNPHLAELSSMLDLKVIGRKMNQNAIKEMILQTMNTQLA